MRPDLLYNMVYLVSHFWIGHLIRQDPLIKTLRSHLIQVTKIAQTLGDYDCSTPKTFDRSL